MKKTGVMLVGYWRGAKANAETRVIAWRKVEVVIKNRGISRKLKGTVLMCDLIRQTCVAKRR